jgi:hypothetical protein
VPGTTGRIAAVLLPSGMSFVDSSRQQFRSGLIVCVAVHAQPGNQREKTVPRLPSIRSPELAPPRSAERAPSSRLQPAEMAHLIDLGVNSPYGLRKLRQCWSMPKSQAAFPPPLQAHTHSFCRDKIGMSQKPHPAMRLRCIMRPPLKHGRRS